MRRLLAWILIGFFAQLIDGALGMAYGVTSTSLLLLFGIAPAVASASVHVAEIFTALASGISHFHFGNVDPKTVYRLIVPGMLGAFLGAFFLSSLPGDIAKPYIALLLGGLGITIFFRFLFKSGQQTVRQTTSQAPRRKWVAPLGFVAGFVDATGGGGWGPFMTPVLLANNTLAPRQVIGSVDTSEFAISLAATLGFVLSLGFHQFQWEWVLALIIGGMVAAPIAAWFVQKVPATILGVLVGGLIVLTNFNTVLTSFAIGTPVVRNIVLFTFLLIWLGAVIYTMIRFRKRCKSNQQRSS